MSLQDELRSAQRCLDDLSRCVTRLEQEAGSCLEMRRVRSDADHLRESLSLLSAAAPPSRSGAGPEMITVSDTPYDSRLWADADDEGLGVCDRHAP
ncbi:hypothetical protein PJ985_04910 [Streptomyces sp. ACA25]|uniref:hypothetical protein n=1 Tax=Streptomyces sp. ACA25 TaxID=3022596 RepID=UPI0023076A0C|nr:hypothetical protein [Streptomyces sp. ACA25]MDB1086903.1 hypothetical protein [Streptomyces sp. ACA25]